MLFVLVSVDQAMDAAVANMDPVLLLNNAILRQALENHQTVVAHGVVYMDKCLCRLEAKNELGTALAGEVGTGALVLALAKGASSTAPGGKKAARDGARR